MFKSNLVMAIKADGKVLREFDGIVGLPYGTEYEIYLKNLSSKRCGIYIQIDGTDIFDNTYLILDGKSDTTIKRYVNDNYNEGNAFKFVEKTEKIEKHRGNRAEDGLITVRFFHEIEQEIPCTKPIKEWKYQYPDVPWINLPYPSDSPFSYDTVTCNSTKNILRSSNVNYCQTVLQTSNSGITVPGQIVEQKFHTTSGIVFKTSESTMTLKLVGTVDGFSPITKPIIVKRSDKCKVCGSKILQTDRFCRECGASTNIITSEYSKA